MEEGQEKRSEWRHREIGKREVLKGCKVIFEEARAQRRPMEVKPQTCFRVLTWAVCGDQNCAAHPKDRMLSCHTKIPPSSDSGSGPDTWESPCQLCVDWCEMMPASTVGLSAHGRNVILGFLLFSWGPGPLPCVLASQEFLPPALGGFFMLEGLAKSDRLSESHCAGECSWLLGVSSV